jgi:hypothetical protein
MTKYLVPVAASVECYGLMEVEAESPEAAEEQTWKRLVHDDDLPPLQPEWDTMSEFRVLDGAYSEDAYFGIPVLEVGEL